MEPDDHSIETAIRNLYRKLNKMQIDPNGYYLDTSS